MYAANSTISTKLTLDILSDLVSVHTLRMDNYTSILGLALSEVWNDNIPVCMVEYVRRSNILMLYIYICPKL